MNVNGHIKEKHGQWYYSIAWVDETGRRRFKERSTKLPIANNKRKAEAILKKAIEETQEELKNEQKASENAQFHKVENMQFTEYIKLWLDSIEGHIDEVTFDWYTSLVNTHIVPYFQRRKVTVGNINPEILQTYFNDKKKKGKLNGKGGLSPVSLKAHKTILNEVLKMAFEAHGKVNPIKNIKIPQVEPRSISCYSVEQCNALLTAIQDEPIYWLVKATLILGLRRSEVLGLQWESVQKASNMIK